MNRYVVSLLVFLSVALAGITPARSDIVTVPRFEAKSFPNYAALFSLYEALTKALSAYPEPVEIFLTENIEKSFSEIQALGDASESAAPLLLYPEPPSYDKQVAEAVAALSSAERASLKAMHPRILEEVKRKQELLLSLNDRYSEGVLLRFATSRSAAALSLLAGQPYPASHGNLGDIDTLLEELGTKQLNAMALLEIQLSNEIALLAASGANVVVLAERTAIVPHIELVRPEPKSLVFFKPSVPEDFSIAGKLSSRAYTAQFGDRDVLLVVEGEHGFRAVAFDLGDGRLVVAYAGTNFRNIAGDVAADLGLGLDYFASRENIGGLATDVKLPINDSKLDSQILQARTFFDLARQKYAKKLNRKPTDEMVTGHSSAACSQR